MKWNTPVASYLLRVATLDATPTPTDTQQSGFWTRILPGESVQHLLHVHPSVPQEGSVDLRSMDEVTSTDTQKTSVGSRIHTPLAFNAYITTMTLCSRRAVIPHGHTAFCSDQCFNVVLSSLGVVKPSSREHSFRYKFMHCAELERIQSTCKTVCGYTSPTEVAGILRVSLSRHRARPSAWLQCWLIPVNSVTLSSHYFESFSGPSSPAPASFQLTCSTAASWPALPPLWRAP